jgi:glycosyltransferase involved in cell wall biosynthesis
MRIAYVCYWSVFRNDGVAKKVTTQVRHWRSAGHETEVFALSPRRGEMTGQAWRARPFLFSGAAGRTGAAVRLLRELRRFRPDLVYLRYDLLPPPLHILPRFFTTIVEVNSDEHAEYRHRRGRRALAAALYGHANSAFLLGRSAGFVCVTNELVRLVAGQGKPTIVIANGVELDEIEPLPPEPNGRPTLAFSGTPGQPWHGVDKLIELAAACPELDVVLLGVDGSDALPPNVTAPGYLDRSRYKPLLARAHAAMGSAALHRNAMTEGSPLKVREYLAYGLPVILPYEDTDLAGLDDWFVLRLPNSERNLLEHAQEIARFVTAARGKRVPREQVAPLIDAGMKESRRLEFFERVSHS